MMAGTCFVFIVALLASPAFAQTKDIKLPGSNSNSPDTKVLWENNCHEIWNKQTIPQIFSTGNSAIDGGIIGLGLGALGAAVLGPTLNQVISKHLPLFVHPDLPQAVSAPQTGCGRRKRQADGEERLIFVTFWTEFLDAMPSKSKRTLEAVCLPPPSFLLSQDFWTGYGNSQRWPHLHAIWR